MLRLILDQLKSGLIGYLRGNFFAWALGAIGFSVSIVTILAFFVEYGALFLMVWAFLFLFVLLAINSILQTIRYRQQFVHKPEELLPREERMILDWAYNLRAVDRNLRNFLSINTEIDLSTIYSSAAPEVTLNFTLRSSITSPISVGERVTGLLFGDADGQLGDTPRKPLSTNGQHQNLQLDRGEEGTYSLRQPITPDLRDRWINNRLNQQIMFDLRKLYISIEIKDPINLTVLHSDRLPVPDTVLASLKRVLDWPWDDPKYNHNRQGSEEETHHENDQ